MAEMCDPKEPTGSNEAGAPLWGNEEKELFRGQRLSEKDSWLPRRLRRSVSGCLTRAPLALMLLFISLGLFLLLLTTLVQVSRIQQSLLRVGGHAESHSPVAVPQGQVDLEEIRQQLTWMNATLTGLCRPCPWNWYLFQGSCYMFSQSQNTWKASASTCEDMRAHLVVISSAEEQKFLKSWNIRNNNPTWIGLSDHHNEGNWKWVDNSTLQLSFWLEGEPNNREDEDCVELHGDGWNDNKCSGERFWICEKPPALCPGL